MSLQLQHYNKSYAYTEKVVTFLPNHPSFILRSSFVHPSFILRSSFDWGYEDDYWISPGRETED